MVDEKLNQFASQARKANQKGEKRSDGTWVIVIRSLVEMVKEVYLIQQALALCLHFSAVVNQVLQ